MASMTSGGFAGRLLVANPQLPDPNFDRTVVFVLAHGDQGALGVVLNRPSDTLVGSPLPKWEALAAQPAVMFLGGPVNRAAAICLGRSGLGLVVPPPGRGWAPVTAEIGTLDLELDPVELDPPVRDIRVFAGYAGWGAGQLEGEIAAGAWWVLDVAIDDVFGDEPDDLWKRVLRRQRGALPLVSAYPDDPAWN
jgi:putative transcriptional regulator